MKINLTAEYGPPGAGSPHGTVDVSLNGDFLYSMSASRRPGAEPGAEDNVITETLTERLRLMFDRVEF